MHATARVHRDNITGSESEHKLMRSRFAWNTRTENS